MLFEARHGESKRQFQIKLLQKRYQNNSIRDIFLVKSHDARDRSVRDRYCIMSKDANANIQLGDQVRPWRNRFKTMRNQGIFVPTCFAFRKDPKTVKEQRVQLSTLLFHWFYYCTLILRNNLKKSKNLLLAIPVKTYKTFYSPYE